MNIPIQSLPDDFAGCPPAGLYRCSDPVYRRIRAVNASRLKLCRESMAAFQRNEPRDETDSMRFGRAIDCFALEGREAFERRYVVAPKINFSVKGAPEAYVAWANDLLGDSVVSANGTADDIRRSFVEAMQARGGDVVDADWLPTIEAMREAIRRNPNAEHHLTGPGEAHVVMVWRDKETGIPAKAQCDRVQARAAGGVWIPDLKVCSDMGYAEPWSDTERWRSIERYCRDYQLPIAAVHYESGWRHVAEALGLDPKAYTTFIMVEKSKTPRCLWVTLGQETMALAQNRLRGWMRDIAGCARSGVWPDAPTELVTVEC